MFIMRLKWWLNEKELIISFLILGFSSYLGHFLTNIRQTFLATVIGGIGLCALFGIFLVSFVFKGKNWLLPVPLLFTEEYNNGEARTLFFHFTKASHLERVTKFLQSQLHISYTQLCIKINTTELRNSDDKLIWKRAWEHLIKKWEGEVDGEALKNRFLSEGFTYCILPHLVLPLSFALGATIGTRRHIVLYHRQSGEISKVLDLKKPRCLYETPEETAIQPDVTEKLLDDADTLILHIGISERHKVDFVDFPGYEHADNVSINYPSALSPEKDWLPYVQNLVQYANRAKNQKIYKNVYLCLMGPAVVAFAVGMAFSRTPNINVCHWLKGKYVPVFSLMEIEERMPIFD